MNQILEVEMARFIDGVHVGCEERGIRIMLMLLPKLWVNGRVPAHSDMLSEGHFVAT